jgi:hypothetical protein
MSYVDAPAIALVATACCICGRELLEAESIKSGIGPVCAEKTGFGREGLPPDVRAEVNRLVYELAALQRHADAIPRIARLRELGFDLIAEKITIRLEQLFQIRIDLVAGELVVQVPRIEERAAFDQLLEGLRLVPGRRFTAVDGYPGKVNVVPNNANAIRALYAALSRVFAGVPGRSPRGPFICPTPAELEAFYARRRAQRAPARSAA